MTVGRQCKLNEVCIQDRRSIKFGERNNLRYIGLESIESNTGAFFDGDLSKTPEMPRANSFHFTNRHVLYGKLRPYLNKVVLPECEGKCSTEIIPLLPGNNLDREYLAYFLRSAQTVSQISAATTGARMPRADMNFVLSLQIPFPSLAGQTRIVDILKRADGIRRLRKQAQKTARQLIPALFIEMFGDPAINPKGWPIGTIGDVLSQAQYGTSKKAHEDGTGLPAIRMGNVLANGALDLQSLKYVKLDEKEQTKYKLETGDILFNRTNSKDLVGKTGMWNGIFEAVAASYFIVARVDRSRILPTYLWAFMNSPFMKRRLFDTARGAIGQSNINSKELKAFSIPLPKIELQETFERHLMSIFSIIEQQEMAEKSAESTFQSLLQRAFSGKL